MELSAKDTRRKNNFWKNYVIYSSEKSAIIKNEDTSKETVYVSLKLVLEEEIPKNTVETFSVNMQEQKISLKKVDSL